MTPPTRTLLLKRQGLALGGRTLIMGIANATPDSFFDGGKYFDPGDPAPLVERALRLIQEGADIIDIGGETAQPASPVLEPGEEIRRVVPIIERLSRLTDKPISIDSYKPEVVTEAIAAGASLINDTSGLADPELAKIAAKTGAGIVCMHIPCHPKERLTPGYSEPIEAVLEFWREKAETLLGAGVSRESIVMDPGLGFGKTPEENLKLIAHFRRLCRVGYPLLFACSRRTFLGDLMGGQAPEQRLEATVAVNAVGILEGADLVRVHDVRFFARLSRMLHLVREVR